MFVLSEYIYSGQSYHLKYIFCIDSTFKKCDIIVFEQVGWPKSHQVPLALVHVEPRHLHQGLQDHLRLQEQQQLKLQLTKILKFDHNLS